MFSQEPLLECLWMTQGSSTKNKTKTPRCVAFNNKISYGKLSGCGFKQPSLKAVIAISDHHCEAFYLDCLNSDNQSDGSENNMLFFLCP